VLKAKSSIVNSIELFLYLRLKYIDIDIKFHYYSYIKTLTKENNMSFNATTALSHLTQSNNPTNRLVSMLGAKHILQSEKDSYVSFRLPKLAKGINHIKLHLRSDDTYTLEFGKVGNRQCKEMKLVGIKMSVPFYDEVTMIGGLFADQLKEIFETETGLYLSL
jgi:hypothetical protein